MTRRIAGVLFAAALALTAVGCGSTSCPTESPKIGTLPPSCMFPVGAPVTVAIRICTTCNQTSPSCAVIDHSATDGIIQLDPTVEACSSSASCPIGCDPSPIQCSFTAPTATGSGYSINVFNPDTGQFEAIPLTVVPSGGTTTCI